MNFGERVHKHKTPAQGLATWANIKDCKMDHKVYQSCGTCDHSKWVDDNNGLLHCKVDNKIVHVDHYCTAWVRPENINYVDKEAIESGKSFVNSKTFKNLFLDTGKKI